MPCILLQSSYLMGLGLNPEIVRLFILSNSLCAFNAQLCPVWLVHKPMVSIIKFSWPISANTGSISFKISVLKKSTNNQIK